MRHNGECGTVVIIPGTRRFLIRAFLCCIFCFWVVGSNPGINALHSSWSLWKLRELHSDMLSYWLLHIFRLQDPEWADVLCKVANLHCNFRAISFGSCRDWWWNDSLFCAQGRTWLFGQQLQLDKEEVYLNNKRFNKIYKILYFGYFMQISSSKFYLPLWYMYWQCILIITIVAPSWIGTWFFVIIAIFFYRV